MNWFRTLWNEIWQPGPTLFGALVGALAKHLWSKFRTRMSVVSWSVQYQHLAMSAEDAAYGKVEVLYNKTPVQNLKMCYLQLENESATDLTDLDLGLSFQDGTHFLSGSGSVEGTARPFAFTERFVGAMARVAALPKEQVANDPGLQYLFTNREFRIPVLNRYTKATFTLLIATATSAEPALSVSCVHRGLRLRPRAAPRWVYGVIFGVPMARAAAAGLVAGLIGTLVGAMTLSSVWLVAGLAFLLGAAATVLGGGIIRLGRYVLRLFG